MVRLSIEGTHTYSGGKSSDSERFRIEDKGTDSGRGQIEAKQGHTYSGGKSSDSERFRKVQTVGGAELRQGGYEMTLSEGE